MTCVVAYVDNDGVSHMAADSAGTSIGQHNRSFNKQAKIFRKGDMLIGYTTSFRMGQIIEHAFKLPSRKKNQTDYEYLVRQFVPAIRKAFLEENYINAPDKNGGTFLIAWNGEVYQVQDDFAVFQRDGRYDSVGSGHTISNAVMASLSEFNLIEQIGAKEAVIKAIDIASRSNITVSGRIDYLSSKA